MPEQSNLCPNIACIPMSLLGLVAALLGLGGNCFLFFFTKVIKTGACDLLFFSLNRNSDGN